MRAAIDTETLASERHLEKDQIMLDTFAPAWQALSLEKATQLLLRYTQYRSIAKRASSHSTRSVFGPHPGCAARQSYKCLTTSEEKLLRAPFAGRPT